MTQSAEPAGAHTAKLIEGAKQEGKMTFYTSTSLEDSEALLKRFKQIYPFIKTELYRANADRLMAKMLTEAQAGKFFWDVQINGDLNTESMKRDGHIGKYVSPQVAFYDEASIDPEGYWVDTYPNLICIGYNTRLVSKENAPKTWDDLLDSKWKGKMGIPTNPYTWFINMIRIRGEEKALEYMKSLSAQDLRVRRGTSLNVELLTAGEFSLGIALTNYRIQALMEEGAPLAWVVPEPAIQVLHPISMSSKAPHPSAAKLFIDFVLSKEGQEILASFYRIPTHKEVPARYPAIKCEGVKRMPFSPKNVDDYEKYVALFKKIFIKK
ncbi:iron-binding periplasmic protein [sediment metagenome]|uniref:Iron-binding periplasmic protein n=1 Tax=sediment metagenome TaxID=749907 RepID=D9PHC2_9ZZZZ